MSKLERILEPGSSEMPDCHCGAEMHLVRSEPADASPSAEIRIYECPNCKRELRVMVWIETSPRQLAP
jgi:hypothetical protein